MPTLLQGADAGTVATTNAAALAAALAAAIAESNEGRVEACRQRFEAHHTRAAVLTVLQRTYAGLRAQLATITG